MWTEKAAQLGKTVLMLKTCIDAKNLVLKYENKIWQTEKEQIR